MIRKVSFYWILLTLVLVDSWLLSKPNILGKIGLIVYKYHYLRSFPRTLLTVWIVVSVSVLIVLLVQFLLKQGKLSRTTSILILGACLIATFLMMAKVYIDFTSWSYSHTGIKFRYGAYLLPLILLFIFSNGLLQIYWKASIPKTSFETPVDILETPDTSIEASHGTLLP